MVNSPGETTRGPTFLVGSAATVVGREWYTSCNGNRVVLLKGGSRLGTVAYSRAITALCWSLSACLFLS